MICWEEADSAQKKTLGQTDGASGEDTPSIPQDRGNKTGAGLKRKAGSVKWLSKTGSSLAS